MTQSSTEAKLLAVSLLSFPSQSLTLIHDCWFPSILRLNLHGPRVCRFLRKRSSFRFRYLRRFHLRLRSTWRFRITSGIT